MSIELRVNAINAFITGCKSDGTWDAIKACCILAGWNNINGALVPLKGTAPTNYNFVSGDYDRATGLEGNGSTKYLDSNRTNNADPQDSQHVATYVSVPINQDNADSVIGHGNGDVSGATNLLFGGGAGRRVVFRSRNSNFQISPDPVLAAFLPGLHGLSRNNSSSYDFRGSDRFGTLSSTSQTPSTGNLRIFARTNSSGVEIDFSASRLAFYSIGESLDLALLDARVTTLINAYGAI